MKALAIALAATLTACSTTTPSAPQQAVSQAQTAATTAPSASAEPSTPTTAKATKSPTSTSTVDEATALQAAIEAGEFVISPERKRIPLATWTGVDLAGNAATTASLTGQVTLVNFWASWCGPCREEWPLLIAASEKFPNVKFVGINTQDSLPRAKEWIATNPTSYPHFYDDRAFIKASLTTVPNMGMPITVVLDKDGKIFAWYSGAINASALQEILSTSSR